MSQSFQSFSIRGLKCHPLSAPIKIPRRNAFGVMTSRPALILELTLDDGTVGWGEVFANWPSFGFLHRARIVDEMLAPLLIGNPFDHPDTLRDYLHAKTKALALQCGEPGPFAQAICGIDIAIWDALARQSGKPLADCLGTPPQVPLKAYASALTAKTVEALVPPLVAQGWQGYKVKVGFGLEADITGLEQLRALVGPTAHIMVDANQAWTVEEAKIAAQAFQPFDLTWIEEPISCDAPMAAWQDLSTSIKTPLAAGENHPGLEACIELAKAGVQYLQPDAIKWGGIGGLIAVRDICDRYGAHLAPHYLGGGVGLAATAHASHTLAAAWLEVDVTENPLRDGLLGEAIVIEKGSVVFSGDPGHGATPSPATLRNYAVT